MQGGVDINNIMNEYLTDENKKIPKSHLNTVCKIQNGKETCRYICLVADGFVCSKNTPMRDILDKRVENGQSKACGDNCDGLG